MARRRSRAGGRGRVGADRSVGPSAAELAGGVAFKAQYVGGGDRGPSGTSQPVRTRVGPRRSARSGEPNRRELRELGVALTAVRSATGGGAAQSGERRVAASTVGIARAGSPWSATSPSCAGSTSASAGSRTRSWSALRGDGLEEVATFRASGNVVFADPAAIRRRSCRSGSKPSSKSGSATTSPSFSAASPRSPRSPPASPFDAKAIEQVEGQTAGRSAGEETDRQGEEEGPRPRRARRRDGFEGRELHWLPSTGLSETEVDLKALDKALGRGTMRTPGTIEQIAKKYCD